MQVPYDEGRANHIGRASCATVGEGWGEALTADPVGQPLSHVTNTVRDADAFCVAEGNTVGCAIASALPVPRGLETLARRRHFLHGNREVSGLAAPQGTVRVAESGRPKLTMHGTEKSDLAIVARRLANKGEQPPAEPTERRAGTKESMVEHGSPRTRSRSSVSPGLDRVRRTASESQAKLTALLHHVDVNLLRSAYGWLGKDAAAGVDGVTWREYGQDLERKLVDLHARIHRNAYRALPSRRVYIPKPDGRQRPPASRRLRTGSSSVPWSRC